MPQVIDLAAENAFRDCRWALRQKAAEPHNALVQQLMDASLALTEPDLDDQGRAAIASLRKELGL